MSAWMETNCLRVPAKALGFVGNLWAFCEAHAEEPAFNGGRPPDWKYPVLKPAPTKEEFLDLVLSEKVSRKRCGFGYTDALSDKEQEKYLPVFLKYFPEMRTDAVRYVYYCYYDGCEAPGYYEKE